MSKDSVSPRRPDAQRQQWLTISASIIMLCLFQVLQATEVRVTNVIKDPGFEHSTAGKLQNWKGFYWAINGAYPGDAEIIRAPDKARNGDQYLQMQYNKSPEAGQQEIMIVFGTFGYPVYQNKQYVLSVWARGKGRLTVAFQRYDREGEYIRYQRSQSSGPLKVESGEEWHKYSWTYCPEKEDHTLKCNFYVTGKIDLDDPSLSISDAPADETATAIVRNEKASKEEVEASSEDAGSESNQDHSTPGQFEHWYVAEDIPVGWDVADGQLPEGWSIEARPEENGRLRRIVNPVGTKMDKLGGSSLLLDGRLLLDSVFEDVRHKKIRVALLARGDGGKLMVRLRQYMGSKKNMFVHHVMEVLNTQTGEEWERFMTETEVYSGSGGPQIIAASLELIGEHVVVDNVEVEVLPLDSEYIPVKYRIPVTERSVTIDGVFSPGEWRDASGCDCGFVAKGGNMVKRQSSFHLTSDKEHLLVCVTGPVRGPARNQKLKHDSEVWENDSFEIHLNPFPGEKKPPTAYQFIFNAAGTVYDQRTVDGVRVPANKDWDCPGLQLVSRHDGKTWTAEIAIPLEAVGLQPGVEFGLNICKTLLSPLEYSNLTGTGYFDYDEMVLCEIDESCPAVFWGTGGEIGQANLAVFANVVNSNKDAEPFNVSMEVEAEKVSDQKTFQFSLPPGELEYLRMNTDQSPGAFGKFGMVTTAESADSKTIVSHHIKFAQNALLETENAGNEILFYPSQKKIGVIFRNIGEVDMRTAPAMVDFSVWSNGKLIQSSRTETIDRSSDNGYARVDFSRPEPGKYLVLADVLNRQGECVEHLSRHVTVKDFPWLDGKAGKNDAPVKPLTSLQLDGNSVSCWGRSYTFAGSGLPARIISQEKDVLNSPIIFRATVEDTEEIGKPGKLVFGEHSGQEASFTGEISFEDFRIVTNGRAEYDGVVFYKFEIIPRQTVALQHLRFEIPFRDLEYFHSPGKLWMKRYPEKGEYIDRTVPIWNAGHFYIPKGARQHNSLYFPAGDGTIWTSENMVTKTMHGDFLNYLTFGNPQYGLSWFAENDRGWNNTPEKPTYEIVRNGDCSTIVINLISTPVELNAPRQIAFALAATPVRPKKTGLNYYNFKLMGFWESSFIDRAFGGMSVKDSFLVDKYIAGLNQRFSRTPVFFYVCKSYFALGDPICKYYYNEWHTLPERSYNARGSISTRRFGANPDNYFAPAGCLYPERIDYMAYKLEHLIQSTPSLSGIYWDENYSVPCNDISHERCGYRRQDGKIQAGNHLYGIRELDERVGRILQQNERSFPKLIIHSTAMIPGAYAFADLNLCGERGTRGLDFVDYWDLPRVENTGAGAWGVNIVWLPQWGSPHGGSPNTLENNRTMLTVLKLFDLNIWQHWCKRDLLQKFRDIELDFGIAADDSRFFGYWQPENQAAVTGLPPHIKASFFVRPGQGALVYISNLGQEDEKAKAYLQFSPWGLGDFEVTETETGESIPVEAGKISLDITRHDFRCLRLNPVDK